MLQHPLATGFIADIELLAHQKHCYLWAMDASFSQELYISATFRNICRREVWEMYQNKTPADFEKYFNPMIENESYESLQNRLINPKYSAIYNFKLPDGSKQMVLDRSFHLNDSEGNRLLIAGVGYPVTKDDFSKQKQIIISDIIDKITLEYYQLLMSPLALFKKSAPNFGKLTKQQQLILKYILHGLTAKEISKETKLSFRTIEFHTNAIKAVYGASSKSELITIAISKNLVAINF